MDFLLGLLDSPTASVPLPSSTLAITCLFACTTISIISFFSSLDIPPPLFRLSLPVVVGSDSVVSVSDSSLLISTFWSSIFSLSEFSFGVSDRFRSACAVSRLSNCSLSLALLPVFFLVFAVEVGETVEGSRISTCCSSVTIGDDFSLLDFVCISLIGFVGSFTMSFILSPIFTSLDGDVLLCLMVGDRSFPVSDKFISSKLTLQSTILCFSK
uniref:Uncharacterized protein n=1 Tax=Cacopsylla melanoneura TaxID=428564 RepID=A0A8D8U7W6_9HEMI